MQFNLFYEEESAKLDYEVLSRHIKACGRISQYLHCNVRKLGIDYSVDVSAFLRHFSELETVGTSIYKTLVEIAKPRPSFMVGHQKMFESNVGDENLVIPTDKDMVLKIAKDLFFKSLSAKSFLYSMFGKTEISWIKDKEKQILKDFDDFHYHIGALRNLATEKASHDIQSRQG